MEFISIKPISVNRSYQGRRFKTPELKAYQEEMMYRLPKLKIPKGKLAVYYQFGVSSKNADGDNLIKATQDILSEKYGFNDKQIYSWKVDKVDVKKGKEYIAFEINPCS